MPKQILSGDAARAKMLSGVKQLSDVVTITLGPKGRNVGLDKKWVEPKVLHDGVSVAREIELPDPFENYAVKLVQQTSSKTNDRAGDGTTTSTLLAGELVELGFKKVEAGANPMTMEKGISQAVSHVVSLLKRDTKQLTTNEEIKQVATISAADENIGDLIAQAVAKVGKEGVITADKESTIMGIELEVKEGMQFNKGYASPLFVTNPDKMEAEVQMPYILVTDYPILNALEIIGFIKRFVEELNRREIVIIAPEIAGAGLQNIILNKVRGGIDPIAIKAPGFAERQKDILEDIATLTGAQVIYRDKVKLEDAPIDMLGRADKVWCDAENTQIIGGAGEASAIEARANSIREAISKTKSDFEKTQLKERLARLVSGAAIIKVGGMTEVEIDEKKERVIDAVEATKSALEEGIIPGGGVELFQIAEELVDLKSTDKDIQAGIDIVLQSLKKPLHKLLSNAGANADEVIKTISNYEGESDAYGYDVVGEKFGDLYEMGIVDPTKVTRNAIQNAASVASKILTTEFVVVDLPEKEKDETL